VNVRASLLDDPSWFVPFIETMTGEKGTVGDDARRALLRDVSVRRGLVEGHRGVRGARRAS
jgi:hypothetical protein